MKKFILVFFCVCLIIPAAQADAQTAKPSPTVTPKTTPKVSPTEKTATEALTDEISNLKERIASRVAQLRLVEKRGIIGTVTEVSKNQVTLTDIEDNKRFVDVDEITKFTGTTAKESFGLSDIKNGMMLSVIGLYNKESRRILARFVDVYVAPVFLTGTISDIDSTDFSIKILLENGKETNVDIENITKTNTYTKKGGIEKSGFSKLEVDQRILVVGFPSKSNSSRIVASRILTLPEVPRNPRVAGPKNQEETKTSSGSSKKTTPTP